MRTGSRRGAEIVVVSVTGAVVGEPERVAA
jgi:hypothetical protein